MRFTKLTTLAEVQRRLRDLPSVISLDCETTSLEARKAELLSVSIAAGDEALIIPPQFVGELNCLKTRLLVLQNFKYDFQVLSTHGIDFINTRFRDIMLMHHLLDENAEHGLDAQVQSTFHDNYKEVFWATYKEYSSAPEEEQLEYQGKDAIYTLSLYKLYNELLADKQTLIEHVHRLARALYFTERDGVCVDTDRIVRTKQTMQAEIEGYLPKLRGEFDAQCNKWELNKWEEELAKRKTTRGKLNVERPVFSFSSDPQLSWLLYTGLSLPVVAKTKKGNPATDYETIEKLSQEYPALITLKDYKGAKTLYATFVEGMLDRVENNKIYPEFNINGTHTGRISHKNPNLGNIPKEGPIRGFFIPSENRVLGGADYSQLEVVIEANFSQDKNLIKIIKEGASKHDITANELKISRDQAKTLNFAMQYRCSHYKVAKLLKCSEADGRKVWNAYWNVYSGVKKLMDSCDKKLDAGEPIVNPFGRARHFPKEFANQYDYERAKRQAYNALIQGTGADITHKAFYIMSERLESNGNGRMLWEVHDELLGEFDKDAFDVEIPVLCNFMESISNYLGFEIPLSAKAYGPLERWTKA